MQNNNVLVVGSGGREHALCWQLAKSNSVNKIFCAPGNDGMKDSAELVKIDFTDINKLIEFALSNDVTLVVIGQEAASEAGLADACIKNNIAVFGPTKEAAKIETSKVFSKQLMRQANIPTAEFETFNNPKLARDFAYSRPKPVVIKADGLATGKGVVIASSNQEIDDAIQNIMIDKEFGKSGNSVVIEDFLKGQEVSTHAFCDGNKSVMFPSSQDHKQIYDGDKGPNTGGMGVIAPVPWVTENHLDAANKTMIQPALKLLNDLGSPFTGTLYPGLMIARSDIKLLEFNSRFGDPECEVYMRLFEGDLYKVLYDCATGSLSESDVKWKNEFAATVILASAGYPKSSHKGDLISGLADAEQIDNVVIFHAATYEKDGQYYTNGGRVLAVTATGKTLDDALNIVYKAVGYISFEGMQYRTDIGKRVQQIG